MYSGSDSTDKQFEKIKADVGLGYKETPGLKEQIHQRFEAKAEQQRQKLQPLYDLANQVAAQMVQGVQPMYQLPDEYASLRDQEDYDKMVEAGSKQTNVFNPDSNPFMIYPEKKYNYTRMTPDEINDYYYLVGSKGRKEAADYIKSLGKELNRRNVSAVTPEIEEFGKEHPFLSLPLRAYSQLGSSAGFVSAAKDKITGQESDINDEAFGPTIMREALTKGIKNSEIDVSELKERLANSRWGKAQTDALEQMPDTVKQFPDNMATDAILGISDLAAIYPAMNVQHLVPGIMAGDAATSAFRSTKERGGTDNQALGMGGLMGGTAAAMGELNINKLMGLRNTPIEGTSEALLRYARQTGIGALTRAGQATVGNIGDQIIMGDQSNYNTLYNNYLNQGYTEDEAREKAMKDIALSVVEAGGTAGLMSGTLGAFELANNYRLSSQAGRRVYDNNLADTMIGEGLKQGVDTRAFKLANQIKGNPDNYNMGQLANELYQYGHSVPASNDLPATEAASVPALSHSANQTVQNREVPTVPIMPAESVPPQTNIKASAPATEMFNQPVEQTTAVEAIEPYAEEYKGNGKTAFIDNYDGTDPETYSRGFNAYYGEGRYGMEYGQTGSLYGQMLDSKVAEAAYAAGMADRNAAVNAQVKQKPVQGGGLVAAPEGATEAQKQFAETVGKRTGMKFEIVDTLDEAYGEYNAEKGTIRIALDTDNFPGTASHELTHYIKDYAPEEYQAYQDVAVQSLMKAEGVSTYEKLVDMYLSRNREVNENFTREDAIDEIAGDAAERFLSDPDLIEDTIKNNRTLGQRIHDFLSDLIESIKQMIQNVKESRASKMLHKDLEKAEQARELWYQALDKASENKTGSVDSGSKFQLKGVDADGIEVYETSSKVKNMSRKEKQEYLVDLIRNSYRGRTAKFQKMV